MTIDEWLLSTATALRVSYGLDKAFSDVIALFVAYLYQYGLNPVITSGFRDPAKQAELLRRWEEGDPSIVYKPATNSKHSVTKWGKPAAVAVDISTSNHSLAAQIANALNIKAGFYFTNPDPVHFYI